MKRWLSLVLTCMLLAGLALPAAAAPSFDPVDIVYGGQTYPVTVDGYALGAENDVTVSISAPSEPSLIRFLNGGTEMGMTPADGVTLSVNDSSSPFFTAVQAALEVDGEVVAYRYAEATPEHAMFYFTVSSAPQAILLYPRDGGPDTYVRLALDADAAGEPSQQTQAGDHPARIDIAPGQIEFVVGGVTYSISNLQDVPENQTENLMDGLEGHVIQFSYESSDSSDAANRTLYAQTKLITPSGQEVRTYANYGNSQNPYTLYFGLPDGVYLTDCTLKVPADGGDVLIPLGDTGVPQASTPDAGNADGGQTPAPAQSPSGAQDAYGINALLETLADEATDPWQKAIYAAGAQSIAETDGTVTFLLRSLNPQYSDLGNYPGENPAGWWDNMAEHILTHDLEASVTLDETGAPDADSIKAVGRVVRNAAEAAMTEFNRKAMRLSIVDKTFVLPADKLTTGEELFHTEMFPALYEAIIDREFGYSVYDAIEYAPLFFAQVSQSLNVKDGPDALTLNCKGVADPAKLLEDASAAALHALSRIYRSNEKDRDEIEIYLLDALIAEANAIRKKGGESFSLTLSADAMLSDGDFGEDYAAYLDAYDYEGCLDALVYAVWDLPDAAAQDFPPNGYMSGGRNGTEVNIKTPDDGRGRYVQIRSVDTDETQVALFVHPGRSARVYVPKGWYYLLIASGEQWYGVEGLFGEEGAYSRSEDTEILNSDYYHTFTLQPEEEGNMDTYGADLSDFQ